MRLLVAAAGIEEKAVAGQQGTDIQQAVYVGTRIIEDLPAGNQHLGEATGLGVGLDCFDCVIRPQQFLPMLIDDNFFERSNCRYIVIRQFT